MALDIYVGPLTRYHSGTWENVAQAWARQQGVEYHIITPQRRSWFSRAWETVFGRSKPPSEPQVSLEEVRRAVDVWRRQLAATHSHVLDWPENAEGEFFTNRPGHDCYYALLLWAAQAEHPELKPRRTLGTDLSRNEAFKASTSNGFRSAYAHLLNCEIWLPAEISEPFRAEKLSGGSAFFGSSHRLKDELSKLNQNTWNESPDALTQSVQQEDLNQKLLEPFAKLGWMQFLAAADWSVTHHVPIVLDY